MFIAKDGSHVSLFDLLTWTPAFANGDTCPGDLMREVAEQRQLGQNAKDLFQDNARWHSQEFSMEIKDDAVILTVFSCYGRDEGEPSKLRVIIPKDQNKPVRVESSEDAIEAVILEKKVTVTP